MLHNVSGLPKFFKMIHAESYHLQDCDLHMQLAGSVSVILNRKIPNPHTRIEFIDFFLQIMPQKNVSSHHD
jgi:hypothetical protein